MTFFKMIAKPTAVALMVVSMACAAQAQSGKRIVLAMAPTDVAPVADSAPVQKPASVTVVRAKRVASIAAPAAQADCFWCNQITHISGMNF